MSYNFLKLRDGHNYENRPECIFATSQEIVSLKTSETYTTKGETVGTYNAGDSVFLTTPKAVEIANRISEDQESDYKWSIDDVVNGYDNSDIFDDLYNALINELTSDDFDEHHLTSKGFNYHDGNNWKSIICFDEVHDDYIYEQIEDESECKKYSRVIEEMKETDNSRGYTYYETHDFWIMHSQFASNPLSYEIYSKDQYDLEDLK